MMSPEQRLEVRHVRAVRRRTCPHHNVVQEDALKDAGHEVMTASTYLAGGRGLAWVRDHGPVAMSDPTAFRPEGDGKSRRHGDAGYF